MWTVKLSYTLPGQDVLVAQFLGEENVLQLASLMFEAEPSPVFILPVPIYVSPDLSHSAIFIVWENKSAFDTWYAVHGNDWEELLAESNAYGSGQGIVFERQFPPYEDYDWLAVSRPDMVLVEDIFMHLSNAKL
jgi:hypothetical protein